jgi:hypothetical protein
MTKETMPVLSESPVRSPATERRIWVRFRRNEHDATCYGEEAMSGWPGSIQDASRDGMSLLLPRRFEPGMVLVAERAAKTEGPRLHLVQVVHATERTNDRWILSCVFAWPLNEQELQAFLED